MKAVVLVAARGARMLVIETLQHALFFVVLSAAVALLGPFAIVYRLLSRLVMAIVRFGYDGGGHVDSSLKSSRGGGTALVVGAGNAAVVPLIRSLLPPPSTKTVEGSGHRNDVAVSPTRFASVIACDEDATLLHQLYDDIAEVRCQTFRLPPRTVESKSAIPTSPSSTFEVDVRRLQNVVEGSFAQRSPVKLVVIIANHIVDAGVTAPCLEQEQLDVLCKPIEAVLKDLWRSTIPSITGGPPTGSVDHGEDGKEKGVSEPRAVSALRWGARGAVEATATAITTLTLGLVSGPRNAVAQCKRRWTLSHSSRMQREGRLTAFALVHFSAGYQQMKTSLPPTSSAAAATPCNHFRRAALEAAWLSRNDASTTAWLPATANIVPAPSYFLVDICVSALAQRSAARTPSSSQPLDRGDSPRRVVADREADLMLRAALLVHNGHRRMWKCNFPARALGLYAVQQCSRRIVFLDEDEDDSIEEEGPPLAADGRPVQPPGNDNHHRTVREGHRTWRASEMVTRQGDASGVGDSGEEDTTDDAVAHRCARRWTIAAVPAAGGLKAALLHMIGGAGSHLSN